jgi:vacuolar iron transporter family protein
MSNPLESWNEEQRSALLYRVCAEVEVGTTRAELFRRLAGEAEAQAAIWHAQVTARGHRPPGPYVPDMRTRVVAALVRRP